MGSIWLRDLPDVCRRAGLDVVVVAGWETRSRSSGGLDALNGAVWHHTASPSSWDGQRDADYLAANRIAQLLLDRRGRAHVIAAGAMNHAGKGGPLPWLPRDVANTRTIGIEMGNAGTGEQWPAVQIDASVALAAELTRAYGFGVDRHVGHKEWCGPGTTTPGRKIDPFGPWQHGGSWGPMQAAGSMDPWRALVTHRLAPIIPAPPIEETNDMKTLWIATDAAGRVWVGDGVTRRHVPDKTLDVYIWRSAAGTGPRVVTINGGAVTLREHVANARVSDIEIESLGTPVAS